MSELFNSNPGMVMPAVNIKETQEAFQIEVAAPGLRKEDFSLNLENNILTLSAQRETRSGFEPQGQSGSSEMSQGEGQAGSTAEGTMMGDGEGSGQTDMNSGGQGGSENAGTGMSPSGGQTTAIQHQGQSQPERYTRREFSYTSFQRSFSLPESTDPERISANYQDGILTITVPKR